MRNNRQLRYLWYRLSYKQRNLIRKLYYGPSDLFDRLSGRRNKYVPPRGFIYTGSPASAKDYLAQGKHQLKLLQTEIDLQPSDSVLDIGSGIGRTAIALTGFIDEKGNYEGFDVVQSGVDWCNKKIRPDYPNFNFTYVPLFNDLYNDSGSKATEFDFPYEANSFEKIYSFSVFTHMLIEEIEHYFAEIRRVLKPGGMACSTFFLYNADNEEYIANREEFSFPVEGDGFRLMDANTRSGNIAIEERTLEKMLNNQGLKLVKIVHGYWKDEEQDGSKIEYQDLVIFI